MKTPVDERFVKYSDLPQVWHQQHVLEQVMFTTLLHYSGSFHSIVVIVIQSKQSGITNQHNMARSCWHPPSYQITGKLYSRSSLLTCFTLCSLTAQSDTRKVYFPLRDLQWKSAALLQWGQIWICCHTFVYMARTERFLFLPQLHKSEECITFDATQEVAVDLLQPAPAVFYDYYLPGERFKKYLLQL